jgi:UDP-N-acetylmuramate dehydrogenase
MLTDPTQLSIKRDFSLQNFNTFGLDVAAHSYIAVADLATLRQIRQTPQLAIQPRLILGGGSNLVLTKDFPGLVLHMVNRGISVVRRNPQAVFVCAAAGESWHGLVQWTLDNGFGGLENLSWIPGSVGACPIQNIGAYGVEVGALIDSVRYYDFEDELVVTLSRAECDFGYRDSVFKHALRNRAVIIDVTFQLPVEWRPHIDYAELKQEIMTRTVGGVACIEKGGINASEISAAVIVIRSRKLPDPAQIGNAGSFFKNPLIPASHRDRLIALWPNLVGHLQPDGRFKIAAGWLIDQCGWKGKSLGAAGVHDRQALVLVNCGHATGAEILQLAEAIQHDVEQRFNILLEIEPVVI